MTQHTPARRLARVAATAALLPLALGATGCSYLTNALHHETDRTFSTAASMEGEWMGDAPWIPADATDIHLHSSTSGLVAQIRVVTDSDLDPALCAQTERLSLWAFPGDWTPQGALPEKVFACGDWDVVPMKDGWFGWTPTDDDEQAHSPSGTPSGSPSSTPSGTTTDRTTHPTGAAATGAGH